MSEKNEWKLVPVIATDDMEAAAEDDYEQTGATFPRWKSAYAAMLNAAPSAPGDAQDDETQAILRWIMRTAESAKEDCGMDPETPAAIRNGRLAAIASAAAQALGLHGGPSYQVPAAGDALDAARYRWLRTSLFQQWFAVGEAEIGMRVYGACPHVSEIDAAVDAALAAQVPQQGEA